MVQLKLTGIVIFHCIVFGFRFVQGWSTFEPCNYYLALAILAFSNVVQLVKAIRAISYFKRLYANGTGKSLTESKTDQTILMSRIEHNFFHQKVNYLFTGRFFYFTNYKLIRQLETSMGANSVNFEFLHCSKV